MDLTSRALRAQRFGTTRAETADRGHLDFRLLFGARLAFADGKPDIVTYPADRAG